ncbi:MmgE/PrpD family protein [Aquabacter spiritensis]|uniref:2-methylcitrate dehydratase PrpD n=1 Tax=Aquabacter spiritensis TaxID=933073 RepID=A0A4R3LWQ3_9HYPH|nr:MmgE/PrpD family protein [Aquabacter spiritensis]TCT05061.1 2-methylcitrate dehydratase PrpD [Aquabacter spiritensis]
MDVTKTLVAHILASRLDDVPQDVRHEAKRALLNIVGCTLGGAEEAATEIAISALGPFSGPANAAVIGRRERFDPLLAALFNGIASHVHDYDDTLPKNYIHASSPVASALLSYASVNRVSGEDFLNAFILGFEVVSRIGNATYPAHYDAGWHSTGSIGVFGAAVAIGKLLGLDAERMTYAIGLAATQAAGIREMFGSMGKGFHPGRSAQSGYMAALLAQKGFTSGRFPLEAPRGFAAVTAARYDLAKVTDGLGTDFDLRENTYKPFACGIVIHPTIDACSQLRAAHGFDAADVVAVELRVAPLVKDLCNKKEIAAGLEGKFSIYHAAAIGLGRGKGGLGEFTDAAVNDPALKRIRLLTEATGDPAVSEDGVKVAVRLADGRALDLHLEASLGNLKRPLSDAQLEDKFRDQAGVLSPARIEAAMAACWGIDGLADAGDLVAAAVPA